MVSEKKKISPKTRNLRRKKKKNHTTHMIKERIKIEVKQVQQYMTASLIITFITFIVSLVTLVIILIVIVLSFFFPKFHPCNTEIHSWRDVQ